MADPELDACDVDEAEETVWSLSGATPAWFSASKMSSHSPARVHRRNWRRPTTTCRTLPVISRQGAPVRAIQKMPSRTRRRLVGLRPFGRRTVRMRPSKKAHSSSDIRLRAKLVPHVEMSPNYRPPDKGSPFVNTN
jgi:hypothetical protein